MEDKRIFDEYQVECNDCQHYWNDTCDGVREGTSKACTSFIATRRTNIPEQIKNLEKRLVYAEKWLFWLSCYVIADTVLNFLRLVG